MKSKPTSELNKQLKLMKQRDLENYYEENKESMLDEDRPFYNFMKEMFRKKKIHLCDAYGLAGMSEGYGGALLRMEKHTSNRDAIIRLCIAGHFTIEETNRALKLYGMNELYARNKRDVCIMVEINMGEYNLLDIDQILEKHGFKGLYADDCE